MADSSTDVAKREIRESLKLSTFFMRLIGFTLHKPKTPSAVIIQKLIFSATVVGVVIHVLSELSFLCVTSTNSPRVEDVVPLIHTVGYGILSISKFAVLYSKKSIFAQLLDDLSTIWPVAPLETEAQLLKSSSLKALRLTHSWYFGLNESGVCFFAITPVSLYFFNQMRGQNYAIRSIWASWYPFNIYSSNFVHVCVYIFEIFSGQSCVWVMITSDLLFTGMASHIILLLKLLQQRLLKLGEMGRTDEDDYKELIGSIQLHQKLIKYCKDLENAFSLVNLINVALSSVNICCVLFVIVLLEPVMGMSNKLFLGASLIQIGIICWYGENIIQENAKIAEAAYNNNWYKLSPRCRRSLAFLIQRAQKPIAFTAMNFTNISLVTYSAILTRSYSYFTLLYTMYGQN
ncbi:unnamed protein product [Leptosia nina]|uniref:Odorant receptor n=1 Tax=Leptosia nina TaxID=320188 RepID=A0AAV1JFM2_9NEOP